jgi:hypothetical protein
MAMAQRNAVSRVAGRRMAVRPALAPRPVQRRAIVVRAEKVSVKDLGKKDLEGKRVL